MRKLTGYRLQFTVFALLFLLLPVTCPLFTVFAQECSDDSQCADNTHYTDGTTQQCIHKHGGICDPGSEFTDPNTGCVYVYDSEEDTSLCETPSPTPETETPKEPEEPTPPRGISTPPPE